MNKLDIVILAAGKGERMVSRKPKVMHEIMGNPFRVRRGMAQGLDPSGFSSFTGYRRETVEAFFRTRRL